jgi:hypothetical protein
MYIFRIISLKVQYQTFVLITFFEGIHCHHETQQGISNLYRSAVPNMMQRTEAVYTHSPYMHDFLYILFWHMM